MAQVYVQYPETGTYMPLKQLRGFSRVHIKTGKSADVTISVPKKELRYWDDKTRQFVTPARHNEFLTGSSAAYIQLQANIEL